MVKYELFYLTLLTVVFCATSQEILRSSEGNVSKKGEPPDKLILQKSEPYSQKDEQQSFMSNIVTWLFPSTKSVQKRGDFNGGYQYLPPSSQSHIEKDCNPCNQEPWIPIASSVGQKTVINFVPPVNNFEHSSDFSAYESLHPPPPSYSPPIVQYSPPPQFRLKDTSNNFGLSKYPQKFPNNGDIIVVDYMVPPPINYRVPSLIYGPPKPLYGAPPPPKPVYGPPPRRPKPIYNPIPPQFGQNNQYLEQPPRGYIPSSGTTYLRPVSQDIAPPPPPLQELSNIYQSSSFGQAATDPYSAPTVPSDSYGAPVTGDLLNYITPQEQLSLPNEREEYIEKSIPLPNLSSFPVLPFRKFGDFSQNFIQSSHGENTEVKIQESVKVADYLASIEHPINVIQAPLIDLSIKGEGYEENDKSEENINNEGFSPEDSNTVYAKDGSNHKPYDILEGNYIREEKARKPYGSINEKLQNIPTKLSENPIVVEDVHAAASSNNDTFVNSNEIQIKRSNDKDIGTLNINTQYDQQRPFTNSVGGTNIIKSLLLDKASSTTSTAFKKSDHIAINNNFTLPPLDYGDWTPTYGVTMSSLRVPTKSVGFHHQATTKKPKLLQIIVPYVTSKQPGFFEKDWRSKEAKPFSQVPGYTGAYTTLLPVFTPPDTTQVSVWSKYSSVEVKPVTPSPPKTTTAVYNIKEFLNERSEQLPFDIISLQKHIDDWTQQAYSLKAQKEKSTPKEIPSEYFTTQTPSTYQETTTFKSQVDYNLVAAAQGKVEVKAEDGDIDSNLVIPTETTTEKLTTTTIKSSTKALWNVSHVTISPQSKEKVYIVTPQTYAFYTSTPATAWSSAPRVENGKVNNGSTYDSHKFSIRVEPQNKTNREKLQREGKEAVKVVYSEWPHLINNLRITTKKPSSRHPLFGLMDISAYTPPPNSTVETILGHSRVALAVTSPSLASTQAEVTTVKPETTQ